MTTRVQSVAVAAPFTVTSTDRVTVPVPSAATTGRVLLMTVAVYRAAAAASVTTPAGWTLVRSDTVLIGGTSGIVQAVFRRNASAEPLSYTVTGSAGSSYTAALIVFEGVDLSTPVDAHAGATNSTNNDPVLSAPSVTTLTANAAVESLFTVFDTTPAPIATPTGTSVRNTSSGTSGGSQVSPLAAWFTAEQQTAGATTARSGGANIAQTVALREINRAPNAPAQTGGTGGVTLNRAAAIRLAWEFSDPDQALTGGDTQTAYGVQFRLVGAGAWTTASGTSAMFHDIAAGLAAGDYEWQVRNTDLRGAVGPYTASAFFTAADAPVPPTLTSAVADGGTVAAASSLETWTHPLADAFDWQVVGDTAGVPNATVFASGTTVSLNVQAPYPDNNATRHFQVRATLDGLAGPWASRRRVVVFVAPPTPTGVLTVNSAAGTITVAVTNPAPTGGQPVVTHNTLRRSDLPTGKVLADPVSTTSPLVIPTGGSHIDRRVASGVNYQYTVIAHGANGTTAQSALIG